MTVKKQVFKITRETKCFEKRSNLEWTKLWKWRFLAPKSNNL